MSAKKECRCLVHVTAEAILNDHVDRVLGSVCRLDLENDQKFGVALDVIATIFADTADLLRGLARRLRAPVAS